MWQNIGPGDPMANDSEPASSQAKASWICPLLAWATQFMLASNRVGIRDLGKVGLLLLSAMELLLIIAGLVMGILVLRSEYEESAASRRSAIAGIVISGGTLLLMGIALVVLLSSRN
jgi:hypothetical protein